MSIPVQDGWREKSEKKEQIGLQLARQEGTKALKKFAVSGGDEKNGDEDKKALARSRKG